MNAEALSDHDLVAALRAPGGASQVLVDEYYCRCIPIYMDFIGIHWHTGFYLDDGRAACPADQLRMIHHLADSIDLQAGERVLDVGCGIGGTVACLARDRAVEVVGLTPVAAQQRAAAAVIARLGAARGSRVDLGHAAALPYPDRSFDVLLFLESPCHFPDRAAFFREAFRVLKPGGRLAGEDWLARDPAATDGAGYLAAVCRSWAIPALDDGAGYQRQMREAGFGDARFVDLRDEMLLEKGFAVSPGAQQALRDERQACDQPLLALTLEGLLWLGRAVAARAFTIGRFSARRPT